MNEEQQKNKISKGEQISIAAADVIIDK